MKSIRKPVLRVVIIYMLFAAAWILVSDNWLEGAASSVRVLTWFQSYKGIAFVLVSGFFLYLVLSREVRQREEAWIKHNADREHLLAEVQRQHDELEQAYEETIEGWARALEMRSREVREHSRRVTELVTDLGRAMGLDEEKISQMRRGSLLHDIGKMNVPDKILLKEGPLTDAERTLIEKHPDWGYEMLEPIEFLRGSLEIPRYHHEKWDGSGYPHRLRGEDIPLAARIFSVVDVWDALTSDRSYRNAVAAEEALAYIRSEAGKAFDPQVVQAFISLNPLGMNGKTDQRLQDEPE